MTSTPLKLTAVGTCCIALGAGAGTLLNAQAASKPATKAAHAKHAKKGKATPAAKVLRRAVHAEMTVPTKTGFKTVTVDRGTIKAVGADSLTIDESTKKLTGKTVTVAIPATAKVRSDRKVVKLADLKAGQKVAVLVLPKRTVVQARTPKQP